jgi:hypothetical protein
LCALALLGLFTGLAGCDRNRTAAPLPEQPKQDRAGGNNANASSANGTVSAAANGAARAHDPARLFREVTAEVGFDENPPRYPDGTFMAPEITPGGVAIFDFDNDGRLDILVIRHPAPSPWLEQIKATEPNRLYRQMPNGTFVEVPGAAGLAGTGFHHGVAVGDVNNDGFPEVYLCNFGGPDQFFTNNGNGTFTETTARAGFLNGANPLVISPDNWSSTAAFFDGDGDGDLDLWVAHFATFDPKQKCKTTSTADELDYCGPHTFPGQLATLWRNNGDGTFTDITKPSGIAAPGRGWGVIAADLTGDGLADIFQANDEEPNQFWVNQGDGTFADEALLRGCALNAFGSVEANMGIAIGDIRNTGGNGFDIYITHFGGETNTLWAAQGDGLYTDETSAAGMGMLDRPFTGWGCGFFDYDNDGFLDLAVANGRVARGPVRPESAVGPFWNRFAEPNLLFRGNGTGKFVDVSQASGDFCQKLEIHRALAFADLNGRGVIDLVGVNLDNTIRVFRNDAAPPEHHWIQVLPMIGKREAIGARVTLASGDLKRSALCLRASSYLSSNDPRIHFGLGQRARVDSVHVVWPSGTPKREQFHVDAVDRVLIVRQGEGKASEVNAIGSR